MQSLTVIKELLDARGLKPRHRLGQNFMHDKNQLARLLEAAQVHAGDQVLEIGPGTGTLTEGLLERQANVVACELDHGLASLVAERFEDAMAQPMNRRSGSLRLVQGDALEKGRRLNPQIAQLLKDAPFKLVANLPYQIVSPLMSALLMDHPNCEGMFVTIQKEVAERLMAKPGSKEYGPLGIIIQSLASVELIGTLSAGCFWPPPKVTSALVAVVPHGEVDASLRGSKDRREFARFVTELFTRRRKQLGTTFGRDRPDWPAGIDSKERPEALRVGQIIALWMWSRRG
jgi:16S rRNA (adenine1518-N6/adenine1519-N6)-dimethyltransferase